MSGEGIQLALIAAVARNGVIGVDNRLPWRLRSDLMRFRSLTMGKPVLMGRKTFDSLPPPRPGKPGHAAGRLPGRAIVVLTRSPFLSAPEDGEVMQAGDLAEGLRMAHEWAARAGVDEVMVAGGGHVFAQTLPLAQRLYLTWVDAEPEGDALFPPLPDGVFTEAWRQEHPAGEADDHACTFINYERHLPSIETGPEG